MAPTCTWVLLGVIFAGALASAASAHGAAEVGSIFVASCVGSVVQKLALFPIDTLKVRAAHVASGRAGCEPGRSRPGAAPPSDPRRRRGPSTIARAEDCSSLHALLAMAMGLPCRPPQAAECAQHATASQTYTEG